MKKFLILFASVSALALAGCNKAEEKAATPAAEAPAAAAPAAEPAAPAAAAPAADAMALDPSVQTMIDQLKAGAATMTPEAKTTALGAIRTSAEGVAKAAGKAEADVKAAGDAAEMAAKTALGM